MPGGGGKKESELDRPALNHPALTQSCFFGGTTSPSAPPPPPNIAPDLEKLDKTKTKISGWSPKRYPCLENMLSLLGLLSCPALSCDCLSSSEQ